MKNTFNYKGHGIYTVSDAARLTSIHPNSIRRWIKGYKYFNKEFQSFSPPVITSTYHYMKKQIYLSFLDLIEIRFIQAFKKHGISLIQIRKAYQNAKELLSSDHPFATKKFKTDGKVIIAEIGYESKDSILIELAQNQVLISKILQPFLFYGIEFNENDLAFRWYPRGKRGGIVIDPEISFGQPIVFNEGIPTMVLANAYKIEKSITKVAHWYEIPRSGVEQAVEFEKSLFIS
ncbi:MAG: DUF433 domain-containing protein [FCB group bacterium]|nr:DUF433 domain-containing protein [FCB group bacterium]